ncbi:MAG: hypothetical protein IH867_10995 [Chloroflexi bacterium]|nr:hypothetical protein [Chloroflexota bacterium]
MRSIRVLGELTANHPALKSLPLAARRDRIKAVSAHINAAIEYLDVSRSETGAQAFLNIYYGMLNLSKAIILIGPRAAKLRQQRSHGISYSPYKQPSGVLSDWITLHPSGAVPLYYETITGRSLTQTNVTMVNVYRYIRELEIEYQDLTGDKVHLSGAQLRLTSEGTNRWRLEIELDLPCIQSAMSGYRHPTMGNLRRVSGTNTWRSRIFQAPNQAGATQQARDLFRPFLLYHGAEEAIFENPPNSRGRIPVTKLSYWPVEEFNLLLAFFHLSSVVRYDPELMIEFQDSKEWPLLLILKRHGLYKFLLLFYSEMLQVHYSIASH